MMQHCLVILFCLGLIHVKVTQSVTWCTISTNEKAKCEGMKTAFAGKNLTPALDCVQGSDIDDCLKMIHRNDAHLITLDGGDIYRAGVEYDVKTVMAEQYNDGLGYYAVAVAKKSDTSVNINSLKGKKSCHTGVKKTAGWNVPVGYLLGEGLMDVVDCNSDIRSAGEFFSQSCAPGALSSKYNPNNDNPASLCKSCIGVGDLKCDRSSSEPYYNYHGAFRCLAEDGGDVAFVKHLTVPAYTDGKSPLAWAQDLRSEDYVLLCPDGTRKPVEEFAACNLAWVPGHAVVTSRSATMDDINSYRKLLTDAQVFFAADDNPLFEMFESEAYQGTDLMFKDSTIMLKNTESTDYEEYLGEAYLLTIRGLTACPSGTARFCVISDAEYNKCQAMRSNFTSENLKPDISCARADHHDQCMKMIKDGQADLVTLDGADIVTGGNMYNLQPVAGEDYGTGDESATYWAVAVAKKSTSFGFKDLKGRKSCHTGIMKTSGWIVPVGTLVDQGEISVAHDDCNVPAAVGEYFSASCVPGAKTPTYDPHSTNPDSLCELCIGEGDNFCVRNDAEPYSGYTGSFRCLVEDAGEVAFVKHVTVGDNTGGNNMDSWAAGLNKADYELLCPDGTRKSIDEWMNCNLARVPSHAVMTSGSKSTAYKEEYWNLLNNGQRLFADETGSRFKIFDSADYSGKDLIFKDSTIKLVDVGEKNTYQKWAGQEYLKSYEAVTCMSVSGSSQAAASAVVVILSLVLTIFAGVF
ncbi:melanotransferrin-like [Antedon mediterranea]|uniref:melanotransferrin-like n=1 Tax=Antedon mediterranea TaxID=105859 RepID=UPI003AF53C81